MDSDLDSDIGTYLQSGERIRWTGRPAQGVRLTSRDIFLIPFSLLWGGFAIFWEGAVLLIRTPGGAGAPALFALWGIPFVCVGLYLIVGRFFADAWVRSRTVYAVTDSRAFLLRRMWSDRLIAARLDGNVQLKREGGGRGTLDFGAPGSMFFNRVNAWGMWTPALSNTVSFIGVDDVMTVYKLVGAQSSN
jgi:hypothetical protein